MLFYFSYHGNKRNELTEIKDMFDITKYDTIVEPFGGSLVFSRYIYSIDPNKKFHCSDNNNELVTFCNNFHKHDDSIIKRATNVIKKINNKKDKYYEYMKNVPETQVVTYKWIVYYLLYNTYYNYQRGRFGTRDVPKFLGISKCKSVLNDFFRNNPYKLSDYKTSIEQFKDDKNALIFLDPPYINSYNMCYKKPEVDWEYLYNFFETCKCHFIMIVNNDFFMRIAFKKYFVKEYSKRYEQKKRSVMHCVFSNIPKCNVPITIF